MTEPDEGVDPAERIAALRELVEYHSARYHQQDAPEITDGEYDALRPRSSAGLEEAHPGPGPRPSPLDAIGAPPVVGFASVTHARPMMSLDNAFSRDELQAWAARAARLVPPTLGEGVGRFVCEPKIDGLALDPLRAGQVRPRRDRAGTVGSARTSRRTSRRSRRSRRRSRLAPSEMPDGARGPR